MKGNKKSVFCRESSAGMGDRKVAMNEIGGIVQHILYPVVKSTDQPANRHGEILTLLTQARFYSRIIPA